jgi:hypothetical protein
MDAKASRSSQGNRIWSFAGQYFGKLSTSLRQSARIFHEDQRDFAQISGVYDQIAAFAEVNRSNATTLKEQPGPHPVGVRIQNGEQTSPTREA